MSEASPDLHPQPARPARVALPPRRSRIGQRSAPAEWSPQPGSARGHPSHEETREPEDGYPLDPPLVDVRIPVRAPHATATAYSRNVLMHRYPDAEVGDDLHILFRERGKMVKSRLSPDVMLALKVPRRSTRADYDVDELGPPDFVLEVLSRSTWEHDIGRKLNAYKAIGVRECLLFDVTGENLAGMGLDLWGFSLTPEGREPLEERVLPNGERGVCSAVLGLVAYVVARRPPAARNETWALTMRWHDPATRQDIPDYDQSREREQTERTRADAEKTRADAEKARADAEKTRADAAETRVGAAENRADTAERAEQAAQRRIAELEERLGPHGGP